MPSVYATEVALHYLRGTFYDFEDAVGSGYVGVDDSGIRR